VHERLSFFAFVTSATMLVSMLFATYPLPFEGFFANLWVVIVTVAVVTPSSFAYKCIGGCLPSMMCFLEVRPRGPCAHKMLIRCLLRDAVLASTRAPCLPRRSLYSWWPAPSTTP
jgi:hypothetical protein